MTHFSHPASKMITETPIEQLPGLLRTMAENRDLEALRVALESGVLETHPDTFGIACAIAPLANLSGDDAVGEVRQAWLARLGFGNKDDLSMALADAGASHVADLVALGADPQRWVLDEGTRNHVTPLQRAFSFAAPDNERIKLITALLDVLHQDGIVPMSLRRLASNGAVLRETNVFDKLLAVSGYTLSQDSFFWDQMLRYLTRLDMSPSWKHAAGDALLRKCATFPRDEQTEQDSNALEYFMDMLPLARFGSPAGWETIMDAVDRAEFVPLLGGGMVAGKRYVLALKNMVDDGVDLDRIPGKVRLVYEGMEHFVSAPGTWLHWAIDNGRLDLFTRLLEAGANPKMTLGDVDPAAAPDIRPISSRDLIVMNNMSDENEWMQALDAAIAKRRIDEVLANAQRKAAP